MKLGSLFRRITDGMAILAGLFLVAIVIIICIDVGMRYFVNNPQVWTVEVCEYLIFGITFFGAPWLLRTNGHVNVDLITEHLPERPRHVLDVISAIVGAIACAILTYFGVTTAIECFQTGVLEVKTLDIPKYIFMIVMAIGYFFLFAEFIRKLFNTLTNVQEES